MKQLRSFTALFSVWLALSPWSWAQQQEMQQEPRKEDTTPRLESESPHWYSRFTVPYQPRIVPPVNVSNSTRLDALLRGGNIYLSLQDAIALGIENNLDIELQRYEFGFANADLLRAQ